MFLQTHQVQNHMCIRALYHVLYVTISLYHANPFIPDQVHILIQVSILVTKPQGFHMHPHQHSIIIILATFHHMYQVGVCIYILVFY